MSPQDLKNSWSILLAWGVLPLAERATRSRARRLYSQMVSLERAPRATIERLQLESLRTLVCAAAAHTGFWPGRLEQAGLSGGALRSLQQLQDLPPVSKSELEQGFPDEVTNRASPSNDWRFAATRGTTQRMLCVHDFAKRDNARAAYLRTLRLAGHRIGSPMVEIPPDVCDVVCGQFGERDDGVASHLWEMLRSRRLADAQAHRDLRGKIERGWIYRSKTYPPFGPEGTSQPPEQLDYYLDRLDRDRPVLVKGLATYLYHIAKRNLERGDRQLRIPIIKPLGSGAAPAMRRVIEQGLGGRFRDDYGSAELGSVACDCAAGAGMHVFADLFIVEVIDRAGRVAPPGEIGEIVITDLANLAMPLIRYRVGDLGRLDDASCSCGRTAPRLHVVGRVHDALTAADGGWLPSHAIAELLYQQPEIDEFQLVEKSPRLYDLAIVPAAGRVVDFDAAARLVAELLPTGAKVRVRSARTILPEPGGKFRFVKSAARVAGPAVQEPSLAN